MKQNFIYQKFHTMLAKLANGYLQKNGVHHPRAQDVVTIAFDDTVIHMRFADDPARRTFHYDLDGEMFVLRAGPLRDYMESFDHYGDAGDVQSTDFTNR